MFINLVLSGYLVRRGGRQVGKRLTQLNLKLDLSDNLYIGRAMLGSAGYRRTHFPTRKGRSWTES